MNAFLIAGMVFVAGAETPKHYYAYDAVEDRYGVIAPWYRGQNGQCDFRVRIAAETLKRYPWTDTKRAVAALPEYIFSGGWKISPEGVITVPPIGDWANGDLGQRSAYVLGGLVDYYRYTGDAAAIAHITLQADALLEYCLTPSDHEWPDFLISVPVRGKTYGQADPHGFIQLDIVAEVGIALVHAAQLCDNARWLEAAAHWGEVLAQKRCREPGMPPWGRYANPADAPWEDRMTGGVVFMLDFFDALLGAGRSGKDGCIAEARAATAAYLRDTLLPDWTGGDTWGRNYWDWPCPVQVENVTEFVARYLMEHPAEFPNWRNDARNILTLFLNRTCVGPGSNGGVASGAWAYPESSGCCGRSLWYGPLELANVYAQYGVLAESEWARELARRQVLLATYDCRPTGVVEDNIDGGAIVAGDWFKIAHPMALKHALAAMAWLPEILGASRENHIVRTTSVVTAVQYGADRIAYRTHAPASTEVLRLAFAPRTVRAGSAPIEPQKRALPDGDWLVTIRHAAPDVVIEGDDSQESLAVERMRRTGETLECSFTGNQVRVLGAFGPDGGKADVYLDGVAARAGIDSWNPSRREGQTLFYANGLSQGAHELRIVPTGAKNPVSKGVRVEVAGVCFSAAAPRGGQAQFGEGGGPTGGQRFLFGYTGREDYVDACGERWRPGTEFIVRAGELVDSVAVAWTTRRTRLAIEGTPDPELYRYGVHGKELAVEVTVGPGTYHARLKLAETRTVEPRLRGLTITVNGAVVAKDMDVAATAIGRALDAPVTRPGDPYVLWPGIGRAVDLVLDDIAPVNGMISVRLRGEEGAEAILQALEIGPGKGGEGMTPIAVRRPAPPRRQGDNLLENGDFEAGFGGELGNLGRAGGNNGWRFVFAGASTAYIFPESAYKIHPEWGLPVLHGGAEALRTHTDRGGHTLVWQEAAAAPGTRLAASVWVRAEDLHGKGFGADPGDAAALIVQELDQTGAVVVSHPRQEVRKACDFTRLALTFTTSAKTVKVRFVLETAIACSYDQGHVTYDDCLLVPQQATGAAPRIEPWRRVPLDPAYAGAWVVAGELDGDGEVEIVSARNVDVDDVHYTSAVVAHKLDGTALWRWGNPAVGRKKLHHDVACQIYDWDGDGRNEVVLATKGSLVELDGASGKERRRLPLPEAATDCLVFANLTGGPRARDVLVKDRYRRIWAYSHEWKELWSVENPGGFRTAHQPVPVDLDGDGRQEVMAGYAMLNADGSVRWTFASKDGSAARGHCDCFRLLRAGTKPQDARFVMTYCGGNGIALLDGEGKALWELGGQHFESIDVGRIVADSAGLQLAVDIDHRPQGEGPLWVIDERGEVLTRIMTDYARHHDLLDWTGDGVQEIVIAEPHAIYDGRGAVIAELAFPLADLPDAAECEALVGDMTGDGVPDVMLTARDSSAVYIYKNEHGARPEGKIPLGTAVNFTLY